MSVMIGDAADTGLYRRIRCPHCGRQMDIVVMIAQLPTHRKKGKGLIESALSYDEYVGFKELVTDDRILFASGKFFDTYRRYPSGKELSRFVGLEQQTVSKHLSRSMLIVSDPQKKDQDGRFEEKRFHLTDEGKLRYAELTYKLMDYRDTKSNEKPLE